MKQGIHLIVKGEVQGVNFRYYTQRKARSLGITGSVRNLPDGDLEIFAEGEEMQLMDLAVWAKVGSPSSFVDEVITEKREYDGKWFDFHIDE